MCGGIRGPSGDRRRTPSDVRARRDVGTLRRCAVIHAIRNALITAAEWDDFRIIHLDNGRHHREDRAPHTRRWHLGGLISAFERARSAQE